MKYKRFLLSLALLGLLAWTALPQNKEDFFETKIRPILATECFSCHTDSQMGGLRMDSREALLKGGKSGPAIVPGDPDKSLLIQAVRHTGEVKMPKGGKLPQAQIDALVEWVKAGAIWPTAAKPVPVGKDAAKGEMTIDPARRAFWSFQPLRVVPAPAVKDSRWAKTEIDRFILARLEKEGLTPVAFADRRTLIRRATLDLTGLPPTAEEIEAFEKDKSADAFAKVIDRLLASPNYGERWGRMWLDVARYGEDDYRSLDPMGRGFAPYPHAYLYRDWVVKAFNDDLPYDQFVRAQLAGDLMDEKNRVRTLPALGFLGQGPWFYDNGAVEVTRADERHDRIDVVSRGFLGLTVGCARCHDHKYDPIPTKDYYAMAGVFASTTYKEYPQVPQSVVGDYTKLEKKLKSKQKMMGEFMQNEGKQLAESLVLQAAKYMQAVWSVKGEPKTDLNDAIERNKLDYELMQRWIRFLERPPRHYPFLKDWQAMMQKGGTAAEAKKLAEEFQSLLLDVLAERKALDEENEIIMAKANPTTKKKEPLFKPHEFVTNDDFCPGCGVEVKSMPIERSNLWMDVFMRDLDEPDLPGGANRFRPGLLRFTGWGLERQLSAERRAHLVALREDIMNFQKAMPAQYPYVHGVADREKPVDLPVSLRGSPTNLGEVVPRGFLSVLSKEDRLCFSSGSGRLELANEILRQPIAMRVIVNRIWKGHFGTGIVDTPSNFGFNGERPIHPELLEYLADFFMKNGLSIKMLHREMMLSAVYQLSNEHVQANYDKDTANRFYWRANRRRMDAEQIRDSLLAASGALEKKMGGPSEALTPQFNRRTLYGKVSRYKLDDYLQLFDFPSANISAEQRYTTNVPLQRLFFMNSDFVQQQAELLAQKLEKEPTREARIQKAYRLIFGRAATPEEIKLGLEYVRSEPMKEYEERKKADEEKKKEKEKADEEKKKEAEKKDDKKEMSDKTASVIAPLKPEMTPEMMTMNPEGMMAGVVPAPPGAKPEEKKPILPVTTWGRYMKVLLSSTEFMFIN
ncbi:MAG TPA: PSD1 and planctomycete cytochrome C domain-containing protein [Blastocatellia bacterium]|nr:PSD1 and planctomycete cytochrome C domain-containing protein [Blastocatellia bacterium]